MDSAFADRIRIHEEAKWAKVKTPGTIAFVVLVVSHGEFQWMLSKFGVYSYTLPSGQYVGKRWMRHEEKVRGFKEDQWFMGEYVAIPNKSNMIGIQWTPVSVE